MRLKYRIRKQRTREQKVILSILRWFVEIALVIALAYGITNLVLERTSVLTDSMSTTLNEGEKVLISKAAYVFSKPKRYDVIVFKQGGNEHAYYNIKRVIGLPGETVQIIDGNVYINGVILEEPMVVDQMQISGLAEDEIKLDKDEYFVLGDNRNQSEDSRFANIGNVVKDDIIGKAWIRLKPFDFVGKINMYEKSKIEENTDIQ